MRNVSLHLEQMFKKMLFCGSLALASLAPAQLVTLSKAVKHVENIDKFLYRINPDKQFAEYLGEVEVDGFSEDDAEVFSRIYQKAKQVGANSFAWQPVAGIDGQPVAFDPAHYRLALYYSTSVPKEDNIAYLFSSGNKPVKIRVDGKKITLQPRSYIKKVITYGGENTVVAGNMLGSKINLSAKEGQPVQYFQVTSFDVKVDQSGTGGLNIKSGDVIGLERSYAEFLSLIYKEQKY